MQYHECAVKDLWRGTAKLFLKYPILWLPFICAHLADYGFNWLRGQAAWQIVKWFATWHSVLGASGIAASEASNARALRIVSILGSGLQYVEICIGAIALVMTAFLVAMILRRQRPDLKAATAELRNYPKRILGYSLKYWCLDLVLMLLVTGPAYRLTMSPSSSSRPLIFLHLHAQLVMKVPVVAGIIITVWIMTPIAIRLLRPLNAAPLTAVEKRLGRYFAMLAALAAYLFGALLFPLELILLKPLPGAAQRAAEDLLGFVLSFPNLLAMIAISLLAIGGDWQIGEVFPRFHFREFLRTLMPLHFGQGEGI